MIRLMVDEDSFDEAMVKRLIENRTLLFRDLEQVKTDGKGYVFSSDYSADVREITAYLDAFEKVIKYHGGSI
jgi:tRNA-dihydrouridine synthase